ncbi:unnamed protein product [Sympodiomycopsis kandeliae]
MPQLRGRSQQLQPRNSQQFESSPDDPQPLHNAEQLETFTVRILASARKTSTETELQLLKALASRVMLGRHSQDDVVTLQRQLLPLRILAARVMLGQYSAEDIAILERVDGLLQHNYGLIKAARTQRENAQKAAETVDQQAQRKEDDLRLDRQRLHEAQIAEATAHQVEINMLQQNYLAFSNAFGIIGIAAAPPSPSPDRRVAPPLSHTCLVEEDIC